MRTAIAASLLTTALLVPGAARADTVAHCRAQLVAGTISCTGFVGAATAGTGTVTTSATDRGHVRLTASLPRLIDFAPDGVPTQLTADLTVRRVARLTIVSGIATTGRDAIRVTGAGSAAALDLVLKQV